MKLKSKFAILVVGSLALAVIASVIARPRITAANSQANTPPTISAGSVFNISINRPLNNYEIARVNDAETKRGDLKVEVVSAPVGIKITNIANYDGVVFARLTLECPVINGINNVTLKVTDEGGLSATANLPVNVVDSESRIYFASDIYGVNLNSGATINEGPPMLQTPGGSYRFDAPGFGGQISGDIRTGEITITNAQPLGSFKVTVTITNDCGRTASDSFTLVVNPPVQSCAAPNFTLMHEFNVPDTYSIATEDFNGDKKADLLLGVGVNLLFYPGQGDGTFGNPSTIYSGWQPSAILMGEFNKDGFKDLAIPQPNGVLILLGRGNGNFFVQFFPLNNFPYGVTLSSITLGDFNKDGTSDVAASYYDRLAIYLGDGNGRLLPPKSVFTQNTSNVFYLQNVGDYNKDGNLDMAVAVASSDGENHSIYVLAGDGSGNLTKVLKEIPIACRITQLLSEDYNADGVNDLAVGFFTNQVTIILSLGNGEFSPPQYSLIRNSGVLVHGDFNRDGKLEFVQSIYGVPSPIGFAILTMNGQGYFCSDAAFATNQVSLGSSSVGDFNGDGQPDLIFVNYLGKLRVFLNATNPITNSPPTIMPVAPLALAQGTTPSDSTLNIPFFNTVIATVSDSETPAANLTVKATSVPSGISLTNFLNTDGTISARIGVNCGVPIGPKQVELTVTDANGGSSKANLVINVTPNKPPEIRGSFPETVTLGLGLGYQGNDDVYVEDDSVPTRLPLVRPTVSASAGFTGKAYVFFTSGAGYKPLRITDAGPIGTHTIKLSATDNCGQTTQKTIKVIVTGGDDACRFPSLAKKQEFDFPAAFSAVTGDFTQDGKLDFAVSSEANNNITIYRGDGAGGFTPAQVIDVGIAKAMLKTGDYNGDGRSDLFFFGASSAIANSVKILANQGNNTFQIVSTNAPSLGEVGDFDKDGKTDIAYLANDQVSILINKGEGIFETSAILRTSRRLTSFLIGDFNGDSNLDVITADTYLQYLLIHDGDGKGNFPTNNFRGTGLSNPFLLGKADFNKDGRQDYVYYTSSDDEAVVRPSSYGLNISSGGFYPDVSLGQSWSGDFNKDGNEDLVSGNAFAIGNGSGGICAAPKVNSIITNGAPVAVADFDGDSGTDLVVFDKATNKISIWTQAATTTGGGCDSPTFDFANSFSANTRPYGLTSGDFNGDGKVDLATTNLWDNTVTVLLAGANGFTKQTPITVGVLPNYIAARDLNGDSKLDLAVVNRGSDAITILLGNGDGTFAKKGDYPVGNKSTGVAFGDFNKDGKLDVILPNDGLGNAVVLDGNGDGSFGLLRYVFAGGSPQPGVVADFNKDGNADVAFPQYFSGEVAILFGNGNGQFQSPIYVGNLGGTGVEAIALGDVNGDGNVDVAVTNTTTNQVFTILSDGRGGFTRGGGFATFSDYPASIVIADFTSDGKADIAVGGYNNNRVHIFKGLGNGFDNNAPLVLMVGNDPLSLLTNDFNGDGKPDLAVANNGSGTVSVLLNGCGN